MKTIGLIEKVAIVNPENNKEWQGLAKIDTGAMRSSMDREIAEMLDLEKTNKKVRVKSALGEHTRHVVKAMLKIDDEEVNTSFSVTERKHMKYKLLIGVNTLKKLEALIDIKKRTEK